MTKERRSSTATVTVMVTDTNDNVPTFAQPDYSATVNEAASAGTLVTAITASDRDSGRFGADSIVYRLDGSDADRLVGGVGNFLLFCCFFHYKNKN